MPAKKKVSVEVPEETVPEVVEAMEQVEEQTGDAVTPVVEEVVTVDPNEPVVLDSRKEFTLFQEGTKFVIRRGWEKQLILSTEVEAEAYRTFSNLFR